MRTGFTGVKRGPDIPLCCFYHLPSWKSKQIKIHWTTKRLSPFSCWIESVLAQNKMKCLQYSPSSSSVYLTAGSGCGVIESGITSESGYIVIFIWVLKWFSMEVLTSYNDSDMWSPHQLHFYNQTVVRTLFIFSSYCCLHFKILF